MLFLLAAEVLLIAHLLFPHVDAGWTPWVAGVAISAGGAALIVRQQELVIQLRAAQAGLAERSRAEERNRIARDLHDVIAHSLTVSLLHISSARLAVSEDPGDAERALAEAERLGRQSLEEVRSIVGLMRSERWRERLAARPGPGNRGARRACRALPSRRCRGRARALRRCRIALRHGGHHALPDRPGGIHERRQARPGQPRAGPACRHGRRRGAHRRERRHPRNRAGNGPRHDARARRGDRR